MKKIRELITLIFAFVAWTGVSHALAMTPPEVMALPDDVLKTLPEVVVTGRVSYVFQWSPCAFLFVPSDDIGARGLYVDGALSGRSPAVLTGTDCLKAGDELIVRGRAQHMLLEPGLVAKRIAFVSRGELPSPPLFPPQDILHGQANNRRVGLAGVAWSARIERNYHEVVTVLRVGTADGPVSVRVLGEHSDLLDLRNQSVRIEGVCLPMPNTRGEFLGAEVEVPTRNGVTVLEPRPTPALDISTSGRGVLAWQAEGCEGRLRRICGEVVYRDVLGRFVLVMQKGGMSGKTLITTRVRLAAEETLPEVGRRVIVEGFPVLHGDYGSLEESRCVAVDVGEAGLEPVALPEEELRQLLHHQTQEGLDYAYRFVKISGRVIAAELTAEETLILRVETSVGVLPVLLTQADGYDDADFLDRPRVEVTGVLDARLARRGRRLTIDETQLLLRTAADIRIVPDGEAQMRRWGRWLRQSALVALPLLLLGVLGVVFRSWRRRELASVIAADRRRIAENLHDSLSQQLAGARMMISSVSKREGLEASARETLRVAVDVLESARREVRGTVLQLKDDQFALKSAEQLIREGVRQIASRGLVRARASLCEFPSWVAGEVKSDLIAIVQEAVSNAVRHGAPRRIVVLAVRTDDGRFVLSVLNDGAPFDRTQVLGEEAGHFGLAGMQNRAERSGFSLSFVRRKEWTEVRLERSL